MKEYLKDKKDIYLFAGLITMLVTVIILVIFSTVVMKDLERLNSQYREITLLKDEVTVLRPKIAFVERKKSLSKIDGIVSAVDDVFSSLGLRNKIKSIKRIGSREISGDIEEDAEVSIDKLNMNEMVNIFHKIENSPMLLVLKKVDIKTSFEKQELLNLNITITLIHGK
ncbi:MAG: hypothetical protein HY754_06020 [Nitrospirae bacterium]|nr:hypothetical protein [Nitrospirota bacterium]